MKSIQVRLFIGIVSIVVVIVAVVAGVKYVHQLKQRRLQRLFAGPCEVVQPVTQPYYPRCIYDLTDYISEVQGKHSPVEMEMPFPRESKPSEFERIGGGSREELETLMGGKKPVDAITAATAVLRLRSPTVYQARQPSRLLRIFYPPNGAVFPPNLCQPCVEWEDKVNDLWQITVGISGTSRQWSFVTAQHRWWFPLKLWHTIQKEAVKRDAWIQVKGIRQKLNGSIQASKPVHFRISPWPADEAVVYRLVAPLFIPRKTPDTFVRDIRSFRVRTFLSAHRKYCFNCHTFSSKTGTSGKLGIQSRYMAGGSYELPVYFGVYDIEEERGYKIRLPFGIQMTTYMAWSPEGKKLAFSANQQLVTLSPVVYETQFAGEATSDIAIYDLLRNTTYLLPGASTPDSLEIYPWWTPDGEAIVYSSVPAGLHPAQVRYDLRIIPFNDGKGGISRAISGASQNGKSNYYPRFSPDGKWFCFTKSDGGSLIKSSSDLFLLPGDLEGPARRLECNADFAADSWHSWSSNSRWLVFASKRDDGVFARLYLTQIDDEGHASPAVRLPVKNPPLESFNIPEFVAHTPTIDEDKLFEAIRVEAPAVPVQRRGSQ